MKKHVFWVLAVMLISIFTLVVFFQNTEAGYPILYTTTDISLTEAYGKLDYGIGGKKIKGEYYSGFGSVSVGVDNAYNNDGNDIWVKVVSRGFLGIRLWLGVNESEPLEADTSKDNTETGDYVYAHVQGYLGYRSANDYDHLYVP